MAVFRRAEPDAKRDEFTAYYANRVQSLRRTAFLLCQDWHLAEDLTQTTFIKLYQVWDRVSRHDVLDRYVRTILMRAFLDERRRPWRRERSTAPGEGPLEIESSDHLVDDSGIRAALLALPRRQRATLVLRFWLDPPVEEVAEIMGCSPGTVRSQTARGLDRLRSLLGSRFDEPAAEEATVQRRAPIGRRRR